MKVCPTCDTPVEDTAAFCRNCGTRLGGQPENVDHPPYEQFSEPKPNPYDKTAEFDAEDISEHKLCAMLVYLMGLVGVLLALLMDKESPYVRFHVRQGFKFAVLEALLIIVTGVLFWTVLVPIAAMIAVAGLMIIRIVCFVQVCDGKVVEPAIIRSLGFLR